MQFTTTKELAAAINPRLNPSYSPNLHKFVRAWGKRYFDTWVPQVLRDSEGSLYIGIIDPEVAQTSKGGFIGLGLLRTLAIGPSILSREGGWFTNLGPGNMTHIADFWERYLQIGRCAIDTEHSKHFLESEGRYVMDGDTRTCTWCGAQHKRRIKTITKEIEHFDPVAP